MSALTRMLPSKMLTKHVATSLQEAFVQTANRKHIPKINTVIDPSTVFSDKTHHYVGGQGTNMIAGPKTSSGRPGFLMAEPLGYVLDKFKNDSVGHRVGPANMLAVRRTNTALVPFQEL